MSDINHTVGLVRWNPVHYPLQVTRDGNHIGDTLLNRDDITTVLNYREPDGPDFVVTLDGLQYQMDQAGSLVAHKLKELVNGRL